jgi:SAM-dependent methyltransferase
MIDLETIYKTQPDAIVREFSSLEEWMTFASSFDVYDRRRMRAIVERAVRCGVHGIHTGKVTDPELISHTDGIHWDLLANGLDMRSRAILDVIAASPFASTQSLTRIYCGEALSKLALNLRAIYPKFVGSQYMPTAATQRELFPILHQDIMALDLPDETFDIVLTIEVLEHIWDLPKAFSEQARVLRKGGAMLATFPFNWNSQETIQKAIYDDGKIHHLVPNPEYHGDSMSVEGILVYQLPGWDIINIAKNAGFSRAGFIFYSTAIGGIVGHDLIGQLIFVAHK